MTPTPDRTETPPAATLTAEEIAAIEERLASVPGGDWHSALGSGHNAMTAVMADVPDGDDDYEPVFICDVIPDYRVEDPQAWENRVPLLTFIGHAPTDIDTLLASHAALRDRLARAEARCETLEDAAAILTTAMRQVIQRVPNTAVGRLTAAIREYDALLATPTDGAVRWHGLTGAEIEAMKKALKRTEPAFVTDGNTGGMYYRCRICGAEESGGIVPHKVGCWLGDALAAAAGRGADGE